MKTTNVIRALLCSLLCCNAAHVVAQINLSQSSRLTTNAQIAHTLDWQPNNSNLCHGSYREPDIIKDFPNPKQPQAEVTHISASGVATLREDGVSILRKNIVVSQPGRLITADMAYIYRDNKTGHITQIKLTGNVHLAEHGQLIVSDEATVYFYPQTIDLKQSVYHIYRNGNHAYGTAEYVTRDATQKIILHHATYSTCSPLAPSWKISGSTIILDKKNNIGHAYNGVITFKHVPILYWPYYSFPLHKERKSGVLMPLAGWQTNSGFNVAWPIYWNMAPNYDMIVTPQYYTNRGSRLSDYFRYLTAESSGDLYASFLPDDKEFQSMRQQAISVYSNPAQYDQTVMAPYLNSLEKDSNQRGFFSFADRTEWDDKWTSQFNFNYVTDPYFFQYMSTNPIQTSTLTNQLLNSADLNYSGEQWQFSALAQGYQTLHIIGQYQNPALDQYVRAPEFTSEAYYPEAFPHTDFLMNTDLANFGYNNEVTSLQPFGARLHIRPGLLWPVYFDGGSLKPQVWLDESAYSVYANQETPGQNLTQNQNRTLPIVALDNSFELEQNFSFDNQSYQQTLEPHFFYLYVPYTNQDNLPNFDSVLLPFSFPQLFALNQYTSYDRLQNANQISLGLTQHIFNLSDEQTLRTDLGLIYYFSQPKVCLVAGCQLPERSVSPVYGDMSFSPNHNWSLSTNLAWDPVISETDNAGVSLNYHRDARSSAGLSYQFVRENNNSLTATAISNPNNQQFSTDTNEIAAGLGWPLSKMWSLLAYSDYNISLQRFDTYYGGLQYDSCCWSLRFITQRSYTDSTANTNGGLNNNYDTGYFVEFELKGLGFAGTGNSNALLRSTIPGYGQY